MTHGNALAFGSVDPAGMELVELESLYRAHLHARRWDELIDSGNDVVVGQRQGARFFDLTSGSWLWNCHSNGGTFNFGHRNDAIVAAVAEALGSVDIGNHHLPSPWRAAAAKSLSATTGDRLPGVVFSSSGSEANELAMKLAFLHTGRRGVVVVDGCYHGTTLATMATTVRLARSMGFESEHIVSVPWNDSQAMSNALASNHVGLVLLEAIPATSGFPLPEPGYFVAVREACDAVGAVLAVDEVQTGLGRTGTVWSHEQDGIVPDMIVTGKGLSGGVVPIAATLMSPALFTTWSEAPRFHVSTFGGSELGCVAALAVCELLTLTFLEHVSSLGERFVTGLRAGGVTVRGRGLTMAITAPDGHSHWDLWGRLRRNGVFGYPAAFTRNVVQFKPALTVTDAEADEIIDRVVEVYG
jgi:putrescine aminotransferase